VLDAVAADDLALHNFLQVEGQGDSLQQLHVNEPRILFVDVLKKMEIIKAILVKISRITVHVQTGDLADMFRKYLYIL
jgi:hypothetical protein